MAKASLRLAGHQAQVVLTMSIEEALYVAAELGGGNSYFHGVASTFDRDSGEDNVYTALVELLRVGAGRRGKHAASYNKHRWVADAQSEREGFVPQS